MSSDPVEPRDVEKLLRMLDLPEIRKKIKEIIKIKNSQEVE